MILLTSQSCLQNHASILLVLCTNTKACQLAAAGRIRYVGAHLTRCSDLLLARTCLHLSPLAARAVRWGDADPCRESSPGRPGSEVCG